MYYYRLTKYDPQYRNSEGAYMLEEWTEASDIGEEFNEKKFTIDEYLMVEEKFINVYLEIMDINNVEGLQLTDLEGPYEEDGVNDKFDTDVKSLLKNIKNNQIYWITNEGNNEVNIKEIFKLILRNKIWGNLVHPELTFQFGYDYYSYISSAKNLLNLRKTLSKESLFLEQRVSPRLEWKQERDYDSIELYDKNIENLEQIENLILEQVKKTRKNHIIIYTRDTMIDEEKSLEIIENLSKMLSPNELNKIVFDET